MMLRILALFAAFGLAVPAHAQSSRPLFESDAVLDIRIDAPMRDLKRAAKRSTDPYPATISVNGESLPMTLAARGQSRRTRGLCRFPPLRVRFEDKPPKTSLFRGQKGLKLVTHCQTRDANRQNLMQEYAAYRMLNALTNEALKVRMARISYVDSDSGKTETESAFFIEDTDEAAKRLGMEEIDVPDISVSQLDPDAAARAALFHYMIGNFDYSLAAPAPGGKDCCHNTKLIGASETAQSGLKPIAYDFDYSGLVDASYAEVPDNIKARNVRQRVYRGYCQHNDALRGQIAQFRARKTQVEAALASTPGMNDRTMRESQAYIAAFFDTLADPQRVERQIIGACR